MITEDDMSFMKEVFMPDTQGNEKPRLPFNQYITVWGYHPLTNEVMELKNKEGAVARMHNKYGDSFQCKYSIPRPSGKLTEMSVISGMMFYSRKDAPYEVIVYDGKEDSAPLAYQTDEDLMLLIAKLLTEEYTPR
jgi:hypothetical protein